MPSSGGVGRGGGEVERTELEEATTTDRMVSQRRRDGEGGTLESVDGVDNPLVPRSSCGGTFARALRTLALGVISDEFGGSSSSGDCTTPFSVQASDPALSNGSIPSSIFSAKVRRLDDALDCFLQCEASLVTDAESVSELVRFFLRLSREKSRRGRGLPPDGFFPGVDIAASSSVRDVSSVSRCVLNASP